MIGTCNRIEISRGALRRNFEICRKLAGEAGVVAMIKADGYGHGMLVCAGLFAELGAVAFGVAEPVEGMKLRRAGFGQPILVFTSVMAETLEPLFDYDLIPVVVDEETLPVLSAAAVRRGREIGLHLKVDAGMGRQGCLPDQLAGLIDRLESLDGLRLEGILAHFPMADEPDGASTSEILAGFRAAVESRLGTGARDECVLHIANSGGILYFPATRLDWVRPGIMLYGYYPDAEAGRRAATGEKLRPAMRFVSTVTQLREVPAGAGLGYGHTAITERRTRLAVLPVGYANGYSRTLSNKAQVLIKGQRAPVIGRVSMNLTLADVTDIKDVKKGDEAVLLGRQGDEEITADEIGAWMNTISYEVLCLLGNLNNRVYVE